MNNTPTSQIQEVIQPHSKEFALASRIYEASQIQAKKLANLTCHLLCLVNKMSQQKAIYPAL